VRYRQLGRTGIEVSEIGFGCGPTAGLMVYGTPEEQLEAAKRAYDLGITYFDTAPIYGDYMSEENLGRAVQAAGIRPLIATKVCLELPDLDDIPAAIRRSVDDSLSRLRVDDVTVIQLHNRVGKARAPKADLGVGALLAVEDVLGPVLDTFRQLRDAGKTRAIGCCAFGGDVECVYQVIDSGAFDTVLVSYSILNPTSARTPPAGFEGRDFGNVVDRAAVHGTAPVVLKVLESGALSGATQPHPTSDLARRTRSDFSQNAQRASALRFLVRPGQTMVQAAIRFALQNPKLGVVLVGFSSVDQLDEAVGASTDDLLTDNELARIESLYASDFGLALTIRPAGHASDSRGPV
jgi:L-galactose dehydrogenase/L-glyceraldehyde 3-phosphate reductase